MRFVHHYALLIAFLSLLGSAGASGAEKKLWEETGETRHGTLEGERPGGVSVDELRAVDAASREKIRSHWDRLIEKTHRPAPDLKYTVPVDGRKSAREWPSSGVGRPGKAPEDFIFVRNTDPSAAAPAGFSSTVNEPSVVAVGDHVFFTGNWYAASSSDGGDTFAFVNPFVGPFADPPSGGFCCDQVQAYDRGTDAVFYLQQYLSDVTTGVHRINVDMGSDGTFDCFYNVTPQIMGFAANNFPDFPDLAVSDGYLYHSANVFSTLGAGFSGAFAARYPLADIGSCQGSVPFDVHTEPSFFSFKLTRGATTTMYFADHISNASLRIWRWPDASAAPTSFDRAVSSWIEATRVCPGPDGRDWCGFIDRRMAGAYVADGTVGFFWVPAQGGGFAFPYTRVAQFSEAALALTGEPIVWSPGFAWAYPSVAVNRNGDLGGTVMAGGGATLFPSCVAWIADDVNGDTIAPLENQVALTGTTGPSLNRAGDYSSVHTYYPNDFLWAGACFAYTSTTAGSSRFILFGREAGILPIFADGFESGNTSAW